MARAHTCDCQELASLIAAFSLEEDPCHHSYARSHGAFFAGGPLNCSPYRVTVLEQTCYDITVDANEGLAARARLYWKRAELEIW
jgi:hypothetical protein